ncbi:DNA cytosine methyltransferase [Sphingobium sp. WTD-1]|uniref:DNA cytosine methyltransferase n=1 Tax=Pseudomonadota TaxID=1224 RepID=UPI0012BB40A7|nr:MULTISPECIES: DNA cytosine methyltransferase [Pseudomonadota]MCE4545068.1 DNA cytosine methyltransferase [Caballeronia sp. PC1]QGP77724.1 DNA cytosine methyltransferase [Sphingobium sp. CAP-1]QKR98486.1 DNA cytosine methyltransferase [Sphingomonas sp. CL5.1]WIA57742.1 DNA cytosine methyltransferase [Sphingobium sp. WTD-1]|tara:strand:+ start:30850 stop:32196 length:1347 start_codon:yes stop_codon:yes gene_type:complete
MMRALDLFSAAAGGWSLGLHRAGFITVAACEIVEWRRILYAENNPHVRLYDDVRALTAARLVSDLGFLPDIIVGSPPCQDISSANTKGRGIEGERSGLYLEAVRLVGDCRPRWFAFENSANLRTRGADRLLLLLETLGYACEPCVVAAENVGANHVRKRSWLIGYDPGQLADAAHQRRGTRPGDVQGARREADWHEPADDDAPRCIEQAADPAGDGRDDGRRGRRSGINISAADDSGDAAQVGCGTRRPGGCAQPVAGPCQPPCGHDADARQTERRPEIERAGDRDGTPGEWREGADRHAEPAAPCRGTPADSHEAGQPDGQLESGLRPQEIPDDGRGDGRGYDRSRAGQMGGRSRAGGDAAEPWADWNGGLARHLRLDDGLSAWVAGTRVAVGGPRGTAAASLIVEAFGDAVLPQIPEAIGRAILRTEAALDLVLGRASLDSAGDER